jgi:phosphatidate cytidylyltransferase
VLQQRLITILIAVPLLLLALFQLPVRGLMLLAFGICLLAAWEWGPLAGFNTLKQRSGVVILLALLLVGSLSAVPLTSSVSQHPLARFILGFGVIGWLLALRSILRYTQSSATWMASRGVRLCVGMGILIPFFWGLLVLRLSVTAVESSEGAWWLLYGLLVVWSVDIGGYVMGRVLGQHALLPRVSPGKTWEGLLGGVLLALLTAYGLLSYGPLAKPPTGLWMLGALLVSLSAVVGDLTESMFKRIVGLKESGQLIPGHGGILDRIDSLSAAIPIFACLRLWLLTGSH